MGLVRRALVCLALVLTASMNAAASVEAGANAPAIEQYAAQELRRYLQLLFADDPTGVAGDVRFLIGSPATNPAVAEALGSAAFPASRDGYAGIPSRWRGQPAFVLGGGSPAGSLWAVYDLVEHWGVRYLIHRDVLPARATFGLPRFVREPALRVRQWRVANELALGPASWGIADYRPILDQLAKLRFNRVLVSVWQHQPYLRYEYGGIKRRSSTTFFGHRFPFTADMIGRWLFPRTATEFENPDLPRGTSPDQKLENGIAHIRAVMHYAKQRGMEVVVSANTTDFPAEFAPVLKNARAVRQVSELTITPGPGTAIDDPDYAGLAETVIRATLDTYPEASYLALSMPEHRQWIDHYQLAWEYLDRRYNLASVSTLAALLDRAASRPDFHGGAQRAMAEVKGDLVNLYLYDKLLAGRDIKVVYSGVAEELYPLLDRLVRPGSELLSFIDYTPSRVLRRKDSLRKVPAGSVGAQLIYTLHDDNVGPLPQLATHSLAKLTAELIEHRWIGFSTRYWLLGDHDSAVIYISKAAWQPRITPEQTNREMFLAICGADCVEYAMEALTALERATTTLELNGLGFAFPVPGMLMKHWEGPPPPAEVLSIRKDYAYALEQLGKAIQTSPPPRRADLQYLAGRLKFGIGYLDAVESIADAGVEEAAGHRASARRHAQRAQTALRRAITAYARVAKDQSDRGAIATLNEFAWRPLNRKVAELAK